MKSIILLFATLTPVLARIGETEKECHKRYGGDSVFKESGGEMVYYKSHKMEINLTFRDEKCSSIMYTKSEEKFTDEEIKKLQSANHSGAWRKLNEPLNLDAASVSEDETVGSVYIPHKKTLIIMAKDGMEASARERKEAAIKNLDGL